MHRFAYILTLILFGADSAFSQTNFSFQHYNLQNGLSDNYIRNVQQDYRGHLWISTSEGLNRFDGSLFRPFLKNEKDSTTISSNISEGTLHLNNRQLLVLTHPVLSIFHIHTQLFSRVSNPALHKPLSATSDQEGKIWLGFSDKLVQTDSAMKTLQSFPFSSSRKATPVNIHRLNNGQLIAVLTDGFYNLNESSGTLTQMYRFANVQQNTTLYLNYSFYHPGSNTLYAGGWTSGLYCINFTSGEVRNLQTSDPASPLNSIPVTTVMKDSRNRLWIGTYSGLALYQEITGKITWIKKSATSEGITDNQVRCLLEDRGHNIWIGTANGLNRLRDAAQSINYLRNEFEQNGQLSDIYDITRLSNGALIVATYGNGLFKLDEKENKTTALPQPFLTNTWMLQEIDQKLYVTGHDKLITAPVGNYRFSETNFLKPYYLNTNLVLLAYRDSHGDTWYSINGGQGLLRQKKGSDTVIHYHNAMKQPPFPHNYFNTYAEDDEGNIWWGVNKFSQLAKWNHSKETFEIIDPVDLMQTTTKSKRGINCLFFENGHLWIGTDGGGLYDLNIKNNQIQDYTFSDGISSETVTQVVSDRQNRLWAGTRKGLSCLLPDRKTLINFSTLDGLPETEFNDGACYYDSVTNKLYLGAKSTLIIFNPDDLIAFRTGETPVYIDEIFINGFKKNTWPRQPLRLKYNQNNIQIHFSAVEFNNPSSLQLEYQLEGMSSQWINAGLQRSISFLNLGDGAYTFKLRAKKTGDADWHELSQPIHFTIQPVVWKTWWFRTAIALFAVGLLVFTLRLYYRRKLEHQKIMLEKQKAIETERSRIAADMHDDLGAGLTRIKYIADAITAQSGSTEEIREKLDKLRSTSAGLVESMGEIIWAMNEKNNKFSDTIYYLRSSAVNYCEENKLGCSFIIPEYFEDCLVTGNFRRNLFLMMKETLHNIVKHAGAKQVTIELQIAKHLLFLIKDDGTGISDSDISTGNGLINLKKRAAEMLGHVEFKNEPGLCVRMTLPLP